MPDSVSPETLADETARQRKVAWLVFQVLAWLAVLGGVLRPISMLLYGRSWSEIISCYAKGDVVELIGIVFWFACFGAVFQRPWAEHLVRTTALWGLALSTSLLPHALRSIVSPIFSDTHIVLLDADIGSRGGIPFWYGILYIVSIGSIAAIVFTASKVDKARGDRNIPADSSSQIERAERFFAVGIAVIFIVIGIRWLSHYLSNNRYEQVEIATTYILLGATITIMISQCFIHRYFLAISAMSVSMVALFLPIIARFLSASASRETGILTASCFPPIAASSWETLLMWVPMFILGGLAFFSKKVPRKLRFTAVLVPLSLMLIGQTGVVSLGGRFTIECTSSSEQPENWPDWLVPPDGAVDVLYQITHTFNTKSLYFKTTEPYPADKTLNIIFERLVQAGFKKLDYSLLNPNIRSSQYMGLGEYDSVVKPKTKMHNWHTEWVNDKDEVVTVRLEHRYPDFAAEDLNTWGVSITLQPPVGWYRKEIDNYKRIHPIGENNGPDSYP